VRLSALHPPLIGVRESVVAEAESGGSLARRSLAKRVTSEAPAKRVRTEASKTRTQQRAAGTNNTALFDIVNRE